MLLSIFCAFTLTERIVWRWNHKGFIWGLVGGLVIGVVSGPVIAWLSNIVHGSNKPLDQAFLSSMYDEVCNGCTFQEMILVFIVSGIVMGLLLSGIRFEKISYRTKLGQNQGMKWSLRNWLISTAFLGTTFGLMAGIIYFPVMDLPSLLLDAGQFALAFALAELFIGGVISRTLGGAVYGLNQGIEEGLSTGIVEVTIFALIGFYIDKAHPYHSGREIIKHTVLRFWLWRENKIVPIRFDKFLDYCSELILIQKVGSGYMFIHRLLLEHFAQKYPPTKYSHKNIRVVRK